MQAPFRQLTRLMTRRSRGGQSIILIAFAFIALIAFVGIATDVAMLFVRFSTLRRAVDAAAIATAGQVRETSNFMTLNAVAKEFMNIHGIDPNQVKVETCDTEIMNFIDSHTPVRTADQARTALITGTDKTVTPWLTVPVSELCKTNPQKFVRVTAALNSQTAFLSLLGWHSVMLETSSVAQTAVLDVAIVLDASMSETFDTVNNQRADAPSSIYLCRDKDGNLGPDGGTKCEAKQDGSGSSNSEALKDFKDFTNPSPYQLKADGTPDLLSKPWGLNLKPYGDTSGAPTIRDECWMNLYYGNVYSDSNYGWAGCCNDPTTQSNGPNLAPGTGFDGSTYQVLNGDETTGDVHRPGLVKGFNPDPNWYLYDADTLSESVIMTQGQNPFLTNTANPGGIKAATVESGEPDGNFSDLICRPFKDVRDAARRFIRRLDFVRGDRAILVTFDSHARAIYPYPYDTTMAGGPYGKMGSTIPIMTDQATAIRTLNMQVGVEVNALPVETNLCVSFTTLNKTSIKNYYKTDETSLPKRPGVPGASATYGSRYQYKDFYYDVNPNNTLTYWTIPQCNDTNTGGGIQAATSAIVNPNWIRRESVWVMIVLSDGYPNRTPPVGSSGIYSAQRDWLQVAQVSSVTGYDMPGDWPSGAADAAKISRYCDRQKIVNGKTFSNLPKAGVTYEMEADGGDYGTQPQWCITTQQEVTSATDRYPKYPWGIVTNSSSDRVGSFGFCPWWTFCQLDTKASDGDSTLPQCLENNPAGLWRTDDPQENASAPICADNDPDSRHFCMDSTGRINPGGFQGTSETPLVANPGAKDEDHNKVEDNPWPTDYYCDPHYDADDYARDRADFAGLVNYMDRSVNESDLNKAGPAKRGNFIAIYSIFFDHKRLGEAALLNQNILGVKLMRYLADVGDNGFVDNHLQRWYRDVRDGVKTPDFSYPTGDAAKSWRNPPTGLNDYNGKVWRALSQGGGRGSTAKAGPSAGGTQPTPPDYNGAAGVYIDRSGRYQYPADEDPCAAYDYSEHPAWTANGADYEGNAKTSCGQYFYVDDNTKINQAFTAIAGRLFTRLSR